ncbi:hypothetical protein [Ulvibacter litoralis]|uniref:Lipoprotein n=1 Tax=Ulvibacter litoralis TaxID=227084 RepID=A0A1G7GR20_9FLAO|nr:hypothetical protein [Ulvibacter litoralis]GHC55398.1 hypothetical protein GCM10008083_19410 [Ulvibacter litoralis]SDE90483.1 hypothetical protein SAMN05421855_103282 [Ulvibacter litoralis]
MKKFIYIVMIAFTALSISSCAESEVSFLDLSGDLGFTGSSADIEEFLTSPVYNVMSDLGLNINPGSEPVNLEGTFSANPYCAVNSTNPNANIGCNYTPWFITFSNQNNETLTINYYGRQIDLEGNVSSEESGSGLISGDAAGNFSVIVKGSGATGTNATVFSGRITFDGILGYQDIFVPNIEGTSDLSATLFNDEDGLAERQ